MSNKKNKDKNVKEFKPVNKKYIILALLIILVLFALPRLFYKNDGMENGGIKTVKYRTYTKEKGWSKWTKNGLTSGNKKDSIKSVQVKFITSEDILYSMYTEDEKWTDYSNMEKENKKNINAVKMNLYYGQSINYEICYRTYNKKDKWLEWNCDNDGISGNSKENIRAIQIKVIPRDIIKNEYLKDYDLNKNDKNIGF